MAINASVSAFLEEVSFNLGAGATHTSPTVDGKDWLGSTMPDFSDNRKFGYPILEGVVNPPGNCNLVLQYAVPTFPIAEPPVLAFSTFQTVGAPGGAWTQFSFRVGARFSRLQVVDTSGAANNGIYFCAFIRGA